MKAFYETRQLFKDYIEYSEPLSYDSWKQLSEDDKAVFLYVQYFREILTAWNRAKSYDGDDEEAVETVIQYLMKNVDKINKDPKRYSPSYIYQVAYNCFYCICHDRARDKQRRELEVSAIQTAADGTEFSLFDTYITDQYSIDKSITDTQFVHIIESLDDNSYKVICNIWKSGKLPTRMSHETAAIVDQLRTQLEAIM